MLQLLDGPCQGTYLCKRSPVYLRAVIDDKGEKDVLDQIEDTPRDLETIYVYKRDGAAGWIHLNGTKVHGYYAMGSYNHLPEVDGETLRDNDKWQEWAVAQDSQGR
jgi:hypothetical protein